MQFSAIKYRYLKMEFKMSAIRLAEYFHSYVTWVIIQLKSRIRLISTAGFILFLSFSCNPEEWELFDCSECYTEEPAMAEINVKVTINNVNSYVVLDFYSGRIEEEILILTDTARTESFSTVLPVNEYYTVTATYYGGIPDLTYYNITAIDGNFVRTEMVRTRCDQPCWVVRGNNFNVKLKY